MRFETSIPFVIQRREICRKNPSFSQNIHLLYLFHTNRPRKNVVLGKLGNIFSTAVLKTPWKMLKADNCDRFFLIFLLSRYLKNNGRGNCPAHIIRLRGRLSLRRFKPFAVHLVHLGDHHQRVLIYLMGRRAHLENLAFAACADQHILFFARKGALGPHQR